MAKNLARLGATVALFLSTSSFVLAASEDKAEMVKEEMPKKAPRVGRSNEGKPGTRKMRYGKTQRKLR